MKTLVLLNEADQSCLNSIIRRNARPPHPDPGQTLLLRKLLSASRSPKPGEDLLTRVELGDLATLVSPLDSNDTYQFRIVMPDDADVDHGQISICTPIAAAVLGRPVGELVQWQTAAGLRRMRVAAISKSKA